MESRYRYVVDLYSRFRNTCQTKNYRTEDFSFELNFAVNRITQTKSLVRNFVVLLDLDSGLSGLFSIKINDRLVSSFPVVGPIRKTLRVPKQNHRLIEYEPTRNDMLIEVIWIEGVEKFENSVITESKMATEKKLENSVVTQPKIETEETKILTENLNSLLKSGDLSDVIIKTKGDDRLPVHKTILAARSPVFLAMFKSDMLDAKTNCIEITDLSSDTVKYMIRYMYTGSLPELAYDSATELLKCSDKYDMPRLRQFCVQQLLLHLNASNALHLLAILDEYREDGSKKIVLEFISKHRDQFSKSGTFDCLNNLELVKEVLYTILNK